MKNNHFLSILCSALALTSCGHSATVSNGGTVKVNLKDEIPLEELNKVLEIDSVIPLRTGDSCAMRQPSKVIYRGQDIYLHDWLAKCLYKYNVKDGTFRQIINQVGHASNEYTSIDDFNLDDEQRIYLLDSSEGKVMVFDNEGNHLRNFKNVTWGNTLAILPDKGFAIIANHINRESLVTAYSPEGKALYTTPPSEIAINWSSMTKGNILAHGDEYIFGAQFDNNIYRTKSAEPSVMVTFDYGDMNCDPAKAADALDYTKGQINLDEVTKKVSFTDNFCLYKQYFTFRGGQYTIIYDTEQHSALALSQISHPYCSLFSEPLAVSPEGNFCVPIFSSQLTRNFFQSDVCKDVPYINHTAEEYKAYEYCLVLGHFKARDKK